MFKKAFTLAEIMIVLTIIGILTAILLPVAFQSAPDENIMKFKKANNTLGAVIRELINADAYYINGDFGTKPDGTLIKGENDDEKKYFCSSFADILSTKSVNCSTASTTYGSVKTYEGDADKTDDARTDLDENCADAAETVGEEIITTDGITYYQGSPALTFGSSDADDKRNFGSESEYKDANGFDAHYKVFCVDVDGIDGDEPPFGYGIRIDGKILPGARALEWANKSIQQGD